MFPGRTGPPDIWIDSDTLEPYVGKIGLSMLFLEMICVTLTCRDTPSL